MPDKLSDLLNDFIYIAQEKTASSGGLWREEPVDLLSFFCDKDYLGENPYPGKQTEILELVNKIIMWKLTGEEEVCEEKLRQITELVLMLGKGCKHGTTKLIEADTGKVWTMQELYEAQKEILITALNEDTQTLTKALASAPVKYNEEDSFLITTYSGHETVVTGEHLFLTRNYGGRIPSGPRKGLWRGTEWKKVKDLKPKDYIALSQRVISEGSLEIDKRELRLIGYWLGDGNSSDPNRPLSFYCSNSTVEEDYCNILRSYGIEPKYPKYANEDRPDRDCKMIVHSLTPWESRKKGNPVNEIAKKYNMYGKTAYTKRIPKEFFELTENCKIEFLRALYATDGWVCEGSNDSYNQIGYCTVSKQLAKDLQLFLNSIGIMSRLYKKKTSSEYGIAYQILINDGYNFNLFCEKICIIGKEDKQRKLFEHNQLGKRKGTDIYWDRIKQIDYIGKEPYYDLTVDEYANYVSDGFIDHNSGKDFLASGILAYMCYLLCCMNDPHEHFNFGQDEPIDLINVAINAYQANNVFFKKFKARLMNCKWFTRVSRYPEKPTEFQLTKNQIRFYKNITAHSAHSEADSFEGFNPLIVIFDEIGGFEVDNAKDCYSTLRSSAASRYNDQMLLIFISFPRSQEDFMMQKYNEAKEKNDPQVYSVIGKTWEVNLNARKESFQKDYDRDPEGARMRYECIPPAYREGLFQFPEKVDEIVKVGKYSQCRNLLVQEKIATRTINNGMQRHFIGLELFNLSLDPQYVYYLGGDCGVETDSYVISLMHAEPTTIEVVEDNEVVTKWFNKPVEDLILKWKPSKKDRLPVDLLNVADIIEQICRQVFVKKALFDKFNSAEVVQRLMSYGVDAEDKNWSNPFQLQVYTNLKGLIYTAQIELLDHTSDDDRVLNANEELKALKLINGNKIDHDSDKSKDFSDARAGAAWLCSMDEPQAIQHFSMPIIAGAKRGSSKH